MGAWIHEEPAEQLFDTTAGFYDTLPPLEHPSVIQARQETSLPRWFWPAAVAVLALVWACSAIWPLGFALSY